jgi:hypothetical protein
MAALSPTSTKVFVINPGGELDFSIAILTSSVK